MSPIKVLHILNVDKQNYYLENLANYSDLSEVEYSFVTFAPPNCDFVRDLERQGRQVCGLDSMERRKYPKAFRELGKLCREWEPDIVHTHLFDPSLIGLTVAKRHRIRTVLTRHHSDAIHEIFSPIKRRFYLALENYISQRSDHIIAPSQMVRDFLVEKEGVADEKVTIIPYGQTTERFDSISPEKIEAVRAELGMNGRLALVCVSRLFHRKGHKYLFDAYAGLKKGGRNAKIYLVGDGDYRAELEKFAKQLGIADDVKFLGWRNDALAIMAAADVIVHPSLEDALSSAVIEAVMLEKPVVATDISGVRDSLGDGKYGRIVSPANAHHLQSAIEEVYDDLDAARRIAKEGRNYVLSYMDARRVSLEYLSIYQGVI